MLRENLKNKLKIYAINRKYNTLAEVAKDFGVSKNFLSQICNGRRNMSIKKAQIFIEKTKNMGEYAINTEDIYGKV